VNRARSPKLPTIVTLDPAQALAGEGSSSRLKALFDIGRLLLEQSEPGQVLVTIHQMVVSHLEPERACLLRVARDGSLKPVSTTNLDLTGTPDEWPVSQALLRKVRDSGLAVLATDVARDSEVGVPGRVARLKLRSVLCVPLSRAPVRGIVYIDSREDHGRMFHRDDLDFLSALAVHASLILDRAYAQSRASEALFQHRERLEVLQEDLLRHEIVGRSPKLLAAYEAVERLAHAGARVLLRGEAGTGKELLARAYAAANPQRARAYVPVRIPALAPAVIEEELFGRVRGATADPAREKRGRIERAHGGVLFLDEIGELDLAVQPKLLRFLESGEVHRLGDAEARRVDALVAAATNRPIERLVDEGRLRDDLIARLGTVVTVPPLRERPEDVPLLVEHFLAQHEREDRRKIFTIDALDALQAYRWEFNVRQLQQVVERALSTAARDVIRADDLPLFVRPPSVRAVVSGTVRTAEAPSSTP
jgi:transcriptional regulator with GAF, ATPase, and Fis domain